MRGVTHLYCRQHHLPLLLQLLDLRVKTRAQRIIRRQRVALSRVVVDTAIKARNLLLSLVGPPGRRCRPLSVTEKTVLIAGVKGGGSTAGWRWKQKGKAVGRRKLQCCCISRHCPLVDNSNEWWHVAAALHPHLQAQFKAEFRL